MLRHAEDIPVQKKRNCRCMKFFAPIASGICILLIFYIFPLTKTCDRGVDLQLPNTTGCNRHDVLCSRAYNNVSFATLHNAYAVSCRGFLLYNHHKYIDSALLSGARAFMLDVVATSNTSIYLCHISCSLGSSNIGDVLDIFADFMQKNPREVLTLIWEIQPHKHVSKHTVKHLWYSVINNSRIFKFVYNPKIVYTFDRVKGWRNEISWNTLQEMIDTNNRLVIFSDRYASMNYRPNWDMCMYTHIQQTRWDLMLAHQTKEPCHLIELYKEPSGLDDQLLIVNMFAKDGFLLQYPNMNPYLVEQITRCSSDLNMNPVFPTVDFWESSDVFKAVDILNGVNSTI